MKRFFTFLLFACIFCQGPDQDLVVDATPFNNNTWYSGYLKISDSKQMHYTFLNSQADYKSDPIILWLNGGPGCSSLIGMVEENGPFINRRNNTENLVWNEYAWNKNANMLYLESPGPVGFSRGSIINSDQSAAVDNLEALKIFFTKFSMLNKNELYMAGESYAGIYIPTLAMKIRQYNRISDHVINLKGFMVGNGCTHPLECALVTVGNNNQFQYEFLFNHYYYNQHQFKIYQEACSQDFFSDKCSAVKKDLDDFIQDTNINIYNLYDKCEIIDQRFKYQRNRKMRDQLDCGDDLLANKFFNDPIIQKKLHISNLPDDFVWQICNDDVYYKFQTDLNATYWMYPILMREGYRIWVYSGDVDGAVPITGTKWWLGQLIKEYNIQVVQPWRPWKVQGKNKDEDQVGGMIWKLQNLTFVSVRNAGHMVPQDQPKKAYAMLSAFLGLREI